MLVSPDRHHCPLPPPPPFPEPTRSTTIAAPARLVLIETPAIFPKPSYRIVIHGGVSKGVSKGVSNGGRSERCRAAVIFFEMQRILDNLETLTGARCNDRNSAKCSFINPRRVCFVAYTLGYPGINPLAIPGVDTRACSEYTPQSTPL